MFETSAATANKKKIRYEPIDRRRGDRRQSPDRRSAPREEGQGDRRQSNDRRK